MTIDEDLKWIEGASEISMPDRDLPAARRLAGEVRRLWAAEDACDVQDRQLLAQFAAAAISSLNEATENADKEASWAFDRAQAMLSEFKKRTEGKP